MKAEFETLKEVAEREDVDLDQVRRQSAAEVEMTLKFVETMKLNRCSQIATGPSDGGV